MSVRICVTLGTGYDGRDRWIHIGACRGCVTERGDKRVSSGGHVTGDDLRPTGWPKPDDFREGVLVALEVGIELLADNDAERNEMNTGCVRVVG